MADDAEGVHMLDCAGSLSELCDWAQTRLPVVLAPIEGGKRRMAKSLLDVQTAARWALDESDVGLVARAIGGEYMGASKSIYGDVQHIVPTLGPHRPLIAFVGYAPSLTDAARGEALTGQDGTLFIETYLAPLGLKKADVALTHVYPVAKELSELDRAAWQGWVERELAAMAPTLCVALGKAAGDALGKLAHFVLPHPAALRRRGDSGEVARKARKIRQHIEEHTVHTRTPVHIAKRLPASQTIFGVVLDPYEIDSQGDVCPPFDVQNACHDYLENFAIVGLQHEAQAEAAVVENFTMQYPSDEDHTNAMLDAPHRVYKIPYGNQLVHSGAWVMGVRVKDPATWAKVEAGEITGFSIGGTGVRTEIGEGGYMPPEVEYVEMGPVARGLPGEEDV